MRNHTHQVSVPMIGKPAPIAQTHVGLARFFVALTILIALVALAPLNGIGQSSGQSRHRVSRLQAKGSVSGSSQPGSPLFLPAVTYGSGQLPFSNSVSVAVADLNGDGKPDIIVANYCSPCINNLSVSVLLGKGDGTFQSEVAYDSGGPQTASVAVADVNIDGKPDLIVAYSGLSMVGVLLGNGDGSFQPAVTYDSGGYGAGSVAVADVNGDGKPDLLVANQCDRLGCPGSLGVLLGNGDGTFQTVVTYSSGGNYTHSVVVADVNGDGKPDLLVGSLCAAYPPNCEDLVGVLLGNGDGTFQPAVTYNSGDQYESSVAVADVNGDGKPDLLTANLSSDTVGVLRNKGDGTFQGVVTYAMGGIYAFSVAIADVNGDGKSDLVVSHEYTLAHHGPWEYCWEREMAPSSTHSSTTRAESHRPHLLRSRT